MNRLVAFQAVGLFALGVALAGCSAGGSGTPNQYDLFTVHEGQRGPLAGIKSWSESALAKKSAFGKAMPSAAPLAWGTAEPALADSTDSPLALARLSERRGQVEQAEQIYVKLIEKVPQNPTPYHRLAVIRARQSRFQEAERYFAKALQLAPSDPTLLSDIGYCYYLQGRPGEAEKQLRRALDLKPNDAATCNNLAILLGEMGHYQEALALFRRSGTEAEAYASLAFIFTQQGKLEKAKMTYAKALTSDPDLRSAAEAMVQLARYDQQRTLLSPDLPTSDPQLAETETTAPAAAEVSQSGLAYPESQGPPLGVVNTVSLVEADLTDTTTRASFNQSPVPSTAPGPSSGAAAAANDTDVLAGLSHAVSESPDASRWVARGK